MNRPTEMKQPRAAKPRVSVRGFQGRACVGEQDRDVNRRDDSMMIHSAGAELPMMIWKSVSGR